MGSRLRSMNRGMPVGGRTRRPGPGDVSSARKKGSNRCLPVLSLSIDFGYKHGAVITGAGVHLSGGSGSSGQVATAMSGLATELLIR